jgi:glycosyltransferase involved in cell wall biosynthesis
MNIVFVTYDIPYPLDAGGKLRAFHLMRQTAKEHRVYCLCFYREKNQLHNLSFLSFCEDVIPVKRKSLYSFSNLAGIIQRPFAVNLYESKQMEDQLERISKKTHADIVQFESFYTGRFMRDDRAYKQIFGTENIEWQVYEDYASTQKNVLVKKLFLKEVHRLKKVENEMYKKPDALFVVSKDNQKYIQSFSDKKIFVIPNGISIQNPILKLKKTGKRNVLFIGNFSYIQNKDAIHWILEEMIQIWDKNWMLTIVGKHMPSDLKTKLFSSAEKYAIEIALHDSVSTIEDEYKNADIVFAPLRIGSGTKFKVLEALSFGIPVVATDKAVEGTDLRNNNHLLIGNTASELVFQLKVFFTDEKLKVTLTKKGCEFVKKNYSWDIIGEDLLKAYENIKHHNR